MAESRNVKIGFRDWSDRATWSGEGWRDEYPVENVGIPEMARVARSTDVEEPKRITATFDQAYPSQLFAMVLPNATVTAEFRIVRRDGFLDEIDDSGWLKVYPEVYRPDQLWWEEERFWGQSYTQEEIEKAVFCRPYDTDDYRPVKEVDFWFRDPGNEDGFIDVAYLTISEAWQLSVNMTWGSHHAFESRSKVVQARGGAKSFDRLPKPRRLSAQVDYMPHEEAMGQAYEIQRQLDITDAFVLHPYPGEPYQWLRTTMIARLRQLGAIERAIHDHDSVTFEFEEVM